jgi:hypothetical protein
VRFWQRERIDLHRWTGTIAREAPFFCWQSACVTMVPHLQAISFMRSMVVLLTTCADFPHFTPNVPNIQGSAYPILLSVRLSNMGGLTDILMWLHKATDAKGCGWESVSTRTILSCQHFIMHTRLPLQTHLYA